MLIITATFQHCARRLSSKNKVGKKKKVLERIIVHVCTENLMDKTRNLNHEKDHCG
jgi:hypothetical protein